MAYQERDYLSDLRTKLKRLRDGDAYEDCFALYIFAIFRIIIEQNGLRDKYPYIGFYADWMVHPALDRNKIGKKIVCDLIDVLKDRQISFEGKTGAINKRLGHPVLHSELKKFFSEHGLDDLMLEEKHWQATFSHTARLIISKPIVLKNHDNAGFKDGEIEGVDYDGYPAFWLDSQPGQQVCSFIACVRQDLEFSSSLIAEHEKNGTKIFQAGLFWDAL